MTTFEIGAFSYSPKTRTFTAEASSLGTVSVPSVFEIFNAATGRTKQFSYQRSDKDSSGEDTHGWWYSSSDNIQVLIIND